jgi:hypothetical protein
MKPRVRVLYRERRKCRRQIQGVQKERFIRKEETKGDSLI